MAKIDLDALSIEELAGLRDHASDKLMEKVAARQAELEAELEKLSHYAKSARKAPVSAPLAKVRKADDKKIDDKKIDEAAKEPVAKEPVAKAA